jgi:hypothetical protein
MSYSRANPSPRYRELIALYSQMHSDGERIRCRSAEETFPGVSLRHQAARIKKLIDATGAGIVLDYGSGKGYLYDVPDFKIDGVGQWPGIIDYWDVDEVVCYDPAYPPFSKLPEGKFDGVICVDVLEHCPQEDVPWIVDEIFSYASRFVFANIACYPSPNLLPTGENSHCTTNSSGWWRQLLAATAGKYPEVMWEVWVQELLENSPGKVVEIRMTK